MRLCFHVSTHINPLEIGDYKGKRTQTVLFFRHLIGIIKLKGIILCFHVSTHITPLEIGNYEGLGTLTTRIFTNLNGIIKSKEMMLSFYVSTHINPLFIQNFDEFSTFFRRVSYKEGIRCFRVRFLPLRLILSKFPYGNFLSNC